MLHLKSKIDFFINVIVLKKVYKNFRLYIIKIIFWCNGHRQSSQYSDITNNSTSIFNDSLLTDLYGIETK